MSVWRISGVVFLCVLVSSFARAGHAETDTERTYTFGVVPQQASEKLAKKWIPLMREISDLSGLRIEFATAPNIPEFEQRLAKGVYDFAYMNPYHFTVFNEAPGYVAINRQRNHVIHGIIVVPAKTGPESPEELSDKPLAFPAPDAFAATLITRAHLDKVAPGNTATFVQSHDSVYRAVANGLFAGGGGIVRTLREMEPEVRNKLEVLWMSPGYTGHAIAAHPGLSEDVRARVQTALIELAGYGQGEQILDDLGMYGFQQATDADWDDVRALGIKQ